MMILAVVRRLPELLELQRERTWQPLPAREMREVTIGIVGPGLDRPAVARLGHGLRRSGHRHPARPDRARNASDRPRRAGARSCRTTSCPSCWRSPTSSCWPCRSPQDRPAHGRATPRRMKPGAWLINVARGRLVDETRAAARAAQGMIGGAILDTLLGRAAAADSPLWDAQPHRHAAHLMVERAGPRPQHRALLRQPAPLPGGEPLLNVVDPGAGY